MIYHSGAGSTKYVAVRIFNYLKMYYEMDIIPVEKCNEIDLNNYDRMIIGFPTYHASPSSIILKYISSISSCLRIIPIYIFTTCGMYPANSLRIFASKCIEKNLMVVGNKCFRTPASDGILVLPQVKLFQKFEKRFEYKLESCFQEIRELFNKKHHKIILPKWKWYSILNYPNKLAGMYLFKPTIFISSKLCIKCDKCVSNCKNNCLKSDNVSLQYYVDNCEHCYRCIHHCPTGAMSLRRNGYTKVQLDENFFENKL